MEARPMKIPEARAVSFSDWPRHEIFRFFSGMPDPFFSVTFPVDVTNVKRYSKARGLSFYYTMVWLCAQALNSVEAFHYTLREGELYRLERRWPSFTDLRAGSENFHIVTMPAGDDPESFCRAAKEKSLAQTVFLDTEVEGDWLFFVSSLPWLPLTSLKNEGTSNPDDSIPRLAWGQYTQENGRYTVGMSVEVNHRFADGLHVGQFYQALCKLIDNLT